MSDNTAQNSEEGVRELLIGEDSIQFTSQNGNNSFTDKKLPLGFKHIVSTYFKSNSTTELELENAINFIEDELTSDKLLVNNEEKLVCKNKLLAEMLDVSQKSMITRDYFESVFNKYADFVTGEPAHLLQIEFTKEKMATILVTREILFHLDFKQIEVSQ